MARYYCSGTQGGTSEISCSTISSISFKHDFKLRLFLAINCTRDNSGVNENAHLGLYC